MRRDYKEVFQDFYDEAIEEGKTDDEAGKIALDKMTDYYAGLADDAHDRAKGH